MCSLCLLLCELNSYTNITAWPIIMILLFCKLVVSSIVIVQTHWSSGVHFSKTG